MTNPKKDFWRPATTGGNEPPEPQIYIVKKGLDRHARMPHQQAVTQSPLPEEGPPCPIFVSVSRHDSKKPRRRQRAESLKRSIASYRLFPGEEISVQPRVILLRGNRSRNRLIKTRERWLVVAKIKNEEGGFVGLGNLFMWDAERVYTPF
jgi:hypothetical protein